MLFTKKRSCGSAIEEHKKKKRKKPNQPVVPSSCKQIKVPVKNDDKQSAQPAGVFQLLPAQESQKENYHLTYYLKWNVGCY